VGDLDNDGHPDLIVSLWEQDTGTPLFRRGGRWEPGEPVAVPLSARSLTLADLDGDGLLDLIAPATGEPFQPGAIVSVSLGRPGGKFAASERQTAGWRPYYAVTRDLDGDMRPEIITVDVVSDTISVLRNLGGGRFEDGQLLTRASVPSLIASIASTEEPGIAYAGRGPEGGFLQIESSRQTSTLHQGSAPLDLAIADVDADGLDDVVVADADGSVYLNRGSQSGGVAPAIRAALPCLPVHVAAMRGTVSVVCRVGADHELHVLNLQGTLLATVAVKAIAGIPASVAVGDIYSDGVAHVFVGLRSLSPTISAAVTLQWAVTAGGVTEGDAINAGQGSVTALRFVPRTSGSGALLLVAADGGVPSPRGRLYEVTAGTTALAIKELAETGKGPSSINLARDEDHTVLVTNSLSNSLTVVHRRPDVRAINVGTVAGPAMAVQGRKGGEVTILGRGWPGQPELTIGTYRTSH